MAVDSPEKPKKPRSAKQLAHDEFLKKAKLIRDEEARARKQEAAPEMTVLPPEASIIDQLGALGAALQDASRSKAQQNETLSALEKLLTQIEPRDYPGLASNPVIGRFVELIGERHVAAHVGDPPGTIQNVGGLVGAQKKPWQWKDVQDRINSGEFGIVTFEPNETCELIWNGLKLTVYADIPCSIPDVFKQVWDERRRGLATAQQHAEWLFRKRDSFDARADPSVVGTRSQYVRAAGQGDQGYHPGMGGFLMEEGEAGGEEGA